MSEERRCRRVERDGVSEMDDGGRRCNKEASEEADKDNEGQGPNERLKGVERMLNRQAFFFTRFLHSCNSDF